MAYCQKTHRHDPKFNSLPDSQEFFDEPERHKCAGCAYEQGFNDAKSGNLNKPHLSQLDQSQAGTVRHKDPIAAYDMGFEDGLKLKP